jgi:PKHD-type hydroxylase
MSRDVLREPGVAPGWQPLDALRSNPRVADAATSQVFTVDECAAIVAECDEQSWRNVAAPKASTVERHKTEQRLPGGNTGWIGERLARRITDINAEVYGFRLFGLEEPVRVFSYRAEEDGQFREHIDLSSVQPLRKLTFSVLLSDPASFEGGELGFTTGPFADARVQGAIAVFPSFVLHQVTPVTAGRRVVIVGWAVGPSFV